MKKIFNRRKFLSKAGIISTGTLLLSKIGMAANIFEMRYNSPIKNIEALNLPWKTQDPFIFCSYHYDLYPGGNKDLGPNSSLEGRNIGQDFSGKDGWSMYHGRSVPGFPEHPHSGFETVSIVTKGMVDHSDSLGGAGRFGFGDVQWLTAGKGVQHAEMFPLLNKNSNPFEIFQIWLNLPAKNKKAAPHYKMLWSEDIPIIEERDKNGRLTKLKLVAGSFNGTESLDPTPDSWAADPENHVQIWTFKMDANASFTIPSIDEDLTRSLYFYNGITIEIGGEEIHQNHLIELDPGKKVTITNGSGEAYFLFLQGRPIKEELIQYGPFVANSRSELNETMEEYRRTEFGGWPWPGTGPVHGSLKGRFSKMPDGKKVLK